MAAPPPAPVPGGVPAPPLALYIHFPWCRSKCPYCDFNSHPLQGELPLQRYLAALIADLDRSLPLVAGRTLVSIFIGGGTPSLLPPAAVEELLAAVRARLTLAPAAEITLEANPGTVAAAHFAGYRAAGVTRLSIGVQSFNPRALTALGRLHGAEEAREAVEAACTHFEEVNLDLMYALPGQSLAEARADIAEAAAWGVSHLSVYQLTLEPHTAFHRAPPPLPDEDLAAAMQQAVEETLAGRGYEHYEISAFARPGHQCHHNLNYWQYGDYLGIGAGAHGKLSLPGRIRRETRPRHPQDYMRAALDGGAGQQAHDVAAADLPFEFMMNALRLTAGFPPRLFVERTGLPLAAIRPQLETAAARGLLEVGPERIAPTALGRRFLNDLLQIFLPA